MVNGFKATAAVVTGLTGAVVALSGCGAAFDVVISHEERRYELPGGPTTLSLRLDSADVEIIGTDGDTISVHERLSWTRKLKPTPQSRREGDTLVLGYRCPDVFHIGFNECKVDYRIQVPRAMAATIHADSGDIRIRGLEGAVRAKASSGDIVGTDLRGGALTASVNSGNIRVSGAGAVEAKASSGNIDLRDLRGDRAVASAASGSVRIAFAGDHPPTLVRASTSSGRMIIQVPATVPYAIISRLDDDQPRIRDLVIDPNSPRKISATADSGSIDISAS